MDIIERTQYSADEGITWKETRELAVTEAVRRNLAVAVSEYDPSACWNVADDVLRLHKNDPDALIQALRDMGALPIDGGQAAQHGYQDGYRDALEYAVNTGSICLHGLTYAVIPAEQHEKGKSAIGTMMLWARIASDCSSTSAARDWCVRHGINWEDN